MRLRTFLIQRFPEFAIPQSLLVKRIVQGLETPKEDPGILRALLLSLGEYPSVSSETHRTLVSPLIGAFQHHPDSGTHSAIAWLLKRWGHVEEIDALTADMAGPLEEREHHWYVNSTELTMAIIDTPPGFLMGSPQDEPDRAPEERLHYRKVDRTFAISTEEVTVNQFMRYVREDPDSNYKHSTMFGPDPHGPALAVSWVHAAKFCRWLSELEGIDKDQMCYPEISEISAEMILPDDCLLRSGYRLPTEGEWECACRDGTVTRRFYGNTDEFVGKYGWYLDNCEDRVWPGGMLQPNGRGLFDVYGNVWEWCLDHFGKLPTVEDGYPYIDVIVIKPEGSKGCVLRGGSITNRASVLRSAQREHDTPWNVRTHNIGFRIVRTMPSK